MMRSTGFGLTLKTTKHGPARNCPASPAGSTSLGFNCGKRSTRDENATTGSSRTRRKKHIAHLHVAHPARKTSQNITVMASPSLPAKTAEFSYRARTSSKGASSAQKDGPPVFAFSYVVTTNAAYNLRKYNELAIDDIFTWQCSFNYLIIQKQ